MFAVALSVASLAQCLSTMQVARLHKVLRKAHWQFFLICLFDAMICTLLWCLVVEVASPSTFL